MSSISGPINLNSPPSLSSSINSREPTSFASCIVPKKSDSKVNKYGTHDRQDEYIQKCWEICVSLLDYFSSRPSFEQVLIFVGEKRNAIAKAFKALEKDKFGVLRGRRPEDKLSTDLTGEYEGMLEDLKHIAENDPTMKWEEFCDFDESRVRIGYRLGKTFKNELIPLTKYIFFPDGSRKSTIAHTYPENLGAAKEHCMYLYDEIFRLYVKDHPDHIRNLIAELHWWLAQAVFYKRGSASCSEIIVGSSILYEFGTLSPYKEGIYVDRVALVTSCEDFIALYPSLRDGS